MSESMKNRLEAEGRAVARRIMLDIADWLEDHATGKAADFYCPSRSGNGAAENAAACLRAMANGEEFPKCGTAHSHAYQMQQRKNLRPLPSTGEP